MSGPALGLIETKGIGGALQATRAASNTGQVVIVSAEQTDGDRMTVKIEGDWSAVQAAVEAGARAAFEAGEFIAMHVIPRTDNGVIPILPYRRFVARYNPEQAGVPTSLRPSRPVPTKPSVAPAAAPTPAPRATTPTAALPREKRPAVHPQPTALLKPKATAARLPLAELEKLAVVKLRRYARTIEELPIKGREISKANRQQLLEAIAALSSSTPGTPPDASSESRDT